MEDSYLSKIESLPAGGNRWGAYVPSAGTSVCLILALVGITSLCVAACSLAGAHGIDKFRSLNSEVSRYWSGLPYLLGSLGVVGFAIALIIHLRRPRIDPAQVETMVDFCGGYRYEGCMNALKKLSSSRFHRIGLYVQESAEMQKGHHMEEDCRGFHFANEAAQYPEKKIFVCRGA